MNRNIISILIVSLQIFSAEKANAQINVNEQRIQTRIDELARFGKDSLGRNNRIAFTKGDVEARSWYMDLMKKAGLEVSIDYAGNIIGKRKGKNALLKPIAFGSHIDMVPLGGNYDGCVGSIGALELITVLNENNITTVHPLELIIFANEEGGTVGSLALAGELTSAALAQNTNSGSTIGQGIKRIGGDPDRVKEVKLNRGDLAAFLELHIEQGGILEKEKIQIGIVEGIVGIKWWEITVQGFANHAGTTPMDMRKDALLAASRLVIAVNEAANSFEGKQVATVGKISTEPGAPNVIPGIVKMILEVRDLSSEKIESVFKRIQQKSDSIARSSGTTISFQEQNVNTKPALTDKTVQDAIMRVTTKLGYSVRYMQSGAGHDAQEMALICPVGMIFIPSIGGISHSPKEFSTSADMARGATVLLNTVLTLDRELK
ncbi:Zn-dependent hydrolase [Pollutibacter soli]|uniref:Zn-dependent hydrolase n=1 Tax=Pollutibacter soli TaxID=3034157 RepID=UPI003013F0CF